MKNKQRKIMSKVIRLAANCFNLFSKTDDGKVQLRPLLLINYRDNHRIIVLCYYHSNKQSTFLTMAALSKGFCFSKFQCAKFFNLPLQYFLFLTCKHSWACKVFFLFFLLQYYSVLNYQTLLFIKESNKCITVSTKI